MEATEWIVLFVVCVLRQQTSQVHCLIHLNIKNLSFTCPAQLAHQYFPQAGDKTKCFQVLY